MSDKAEQVFGIGKCFANQAAHPLTECEIEPLNMLFAEGMNAEIMLKLHTESPPREFELGFC